MLCTKIVFCFCFDIQNNICTQHVLNLYFSCNSMNNLSSYCGLTDSRMRASDTDLPGTRGEKNQNISHLCTSWIQVDFPHPEVPTKATVSPFLIVKDNPCRIGTSGLAGYLNSTSVNTMSLPLLSGRKPELR